ncbi:hypothetical protein F5I97DRAFT_1849074 [Phlebopus sp. FC_14]|nr:hypothetical protein F5I97DRAFT_1849074 [Phlebopus sp. FC_14]
MGHDPGHHDRRPLPSHNMSRISQTLSLLHSNLKSLSFGSAESEVAIVTEQFLPRRQDAVFGDQFVFQTATSNQCIHAKLLLLPPFPYDLSPFAKSVAYLSSRSGSINAEMYRLPGAENHFFRLYIFTREGSVRVTLPPFFRGVVTIKNYEGLCNGKQIRCSRSFHDRMRRGFIRVNTCALDNDDELCIHAEGKIELRLMANGDKRKVGWRRFNRHVRRIFSMA